MMTAFIRTLILYILIMAGLRLLGKRQIGELEPSELVLTMMLSDLATVPMQDFGIPLISGIIPICTLLILSLLTSQLSLQSVRFREMVCGKPSVLIRKGVIQQQAMQQNRYTLDELLEELREQGYEDLRQIKYAILENSGQLSILPWAKYAPVTAEQLGLEVQEEGSLPTVVINDGQVLPQKLNQLGKDPAWLTEILREQGFSSPKDVFLLSADEEGQILCIKKEWKE